MNYNLHDADPELWAWVKSMAHLSGTSINTFILNTLTILMNTQIKEQIEEFKKQGEKTDTSNP